MGVFSPIQEPMDWCAGMVPLRKKNGQVRICVGLTQLNECKKRITHIIGGRACSGTIGWSQSALQARREFGILPNTIGPQIG